MTGLALAFIALLEYVTRSSSGSISPKSQERLVLAKEHWVQAALPLGSLIYCLHTYFADPSSLIAWSWTGYENGAPRGPLPHLHGSFTLLAQSIGLLIPFALSSISPSATGLLSHPIWFSFGASASYSLLVYKNYKGYAGGLAFAIFCMSIVPTIFQRAASSGHVARTFFTAFLVYCLLVLASVWTVAYAFVPGGVYLRERTDL